MIQELNIRNTVDENGNPAGGHVFGTGLDIDWQDGPLGRGDERHEPNGAFVESVLEAAASRLRFYQSSRFACTENADALECVEVALQHLQSRTAKREERQVEGTHES